MQQADVTLLRRAFRSAFPHTLPVLTGFAVLGIAYGVLMNTKGYGVFWAVLMSAAAFCGSMQFVAITLLTAAFNPVQALILSIMVNARHLFYGIALLDKYKGLGKIRFFLIFWLCDETFSIACSADPPAGIPKAYFYGWISFLNYSYWVCATFIGGVLGQLLTFNTAGLDFVLTALFTVLFLEQLLTKENRLPGMIGLVCTIAGRLLFGADNCVIPSMLLILAAFIFGRKYLEKAGARHAS